MNPFVSVIIPMLNAERYIEQTLDSLVALDYPDEAIEIIVVDDGSQDRSLSIAKQYNVRTIVTKDKTISKLRNMGAAIATGDLLLFLDADCIIEKDWILNGLPFLADPNVGLVGQRGHVYEKFNFFQKVSTFRYQQTDEVQEVSCIDGRSILVKREVFNEVGGFNEDYATGEDTDFSYRVSNKYKILRIKRMVTYHLGEDISPAVMFKKELWRAQYVIRILVNNRILNKEYKAIVLPIYCLGSELLILISCFHSLHSKDGLLLIQLSLVLFLLPVFLYAIKNFSGRGSYFIPLSFMFIIHETARSFALIRELYEIILSKLVKTKNMILQKGEVKK